MTVESREPTPKRESEPVADRTERRSTVSVIAREVVPGYVTLEFLTHTRAGRHTTPAGLLSLPVTEYRSTGWARLLQSADYYRDEVEWAESQRTTEQQRGAKR